MRRRAHPAIAWLPFGRYWWVPIPVPIVNPMQAHSHPAQPFDGPVPGVPGATIREVAELPEHLAGGACIGPCTEAAPNALLFEIPRLARYLVRDGKTIEIAVAANADRAAARLFLLGSARGALIHQRGELPLNAATLVAPNWKCVAICAPSAIGKSTLAAALCRRGWLLVADDITRVSWNGTMAVAWPGPDRLKLWRDACEMAGENADALERVRDGLERFYLPVRTVTTPASLSVAIRLHIAPHIDKIELTPPERGELLTEGTFRPRWIDPLGRRADHVRIVGQVARVCRGIVLTGARERGIEELADRVAEIVR